MISQKLKLNQVMSWKVQLNQIVTFRKVTLSWIMFQKVQIHQIIYWTVPIIQGGTGDVPKDEKKNIRPGRGVQPLDYRQSQRIVLNAKPVQLTRGMLWVEKVK